MDVTFSNVLEGARQYFQGLPSPANTSSSSQAPQSDCNVNGGLNNSSPHYNHLDISGITGASVYENVNAGTHILNQQPKQHAVIPSVQTHQKNIASTESSACSSVLNYWPAYQRTKDNTVPTSSESYHNLASRSYTSSKVLTSQSQNAAPLLYNGSRMPLPEANSVNYQLKNNIHQSLQPRPQGHNLPPIAALSNYHSNRVTSNSSIREKTLPCPSQTTHHIHPTSASQSIQLLDRSVRPKTEYTSRSQHDDIDYATGTSVTTVTNSTVSHYATNKYQQIDSVATYSKITPQQIPLLASASATSSTSSSSSSKYELSSQHGTIQHHQQQLQHHLQQPQCHQQQEQQQHLNQQYVTLHTNGGPHPQQTDSQTKYEKRLSSHSSKQYSHEVHFTSNRLQAPPSTIVHTSSQQFCTLSTASSSVPSPSVRNCSGRNKRESPLDLSVKTVRQSADSTAKDDNDCGYSLPGYSSSSLDHQSRTKQHSLPGMTTVRSRTPQKQTVILPPLQLPSSIAYPTFDTRTSKTSANGSSAAANISNECNMGAPKVDFLPNFGTSHNAVTTYSSKIQQNCSTKSSLHHPTYKQQVSAAPLPNVGSFKNIGNASSVHATYEPKLATHFPSALSQTQHRHLATNSSCSSAAYLLPGSDSNIAAGHENVKLVPNTVANYRNVHLDYTNRIAGSCNNTTYSVLGQKRASEMRHPSPSKLPKLDTWRQTIDQQIEQRLSSYSSSRAQQQQLNGNMSNCNFSHDAQYTSHLSQQRFQNQQQQYNLSAVSRSQAIVTSSAQHSLQTATQSVHYYSSHGHTHYANVTAQHPSERGNSVHKLHNSNASLISQQANERICAPTDKRVLSILRNSLEIKEARMTELQNQLAQNQLLEQSTCIHQNERSTAASQNHSKQAKQYAQQLNEIPNLQHSAMSKSSVEILTPQKLISPYEDILLPNSLDKPHQISIAETQKSQMPKGIESSQLVVASADIYSAAKPSDDNQHIRAELTENKCGSNNLSSAGAPGSGDAEVIASYLLAARAFRTKAELKQVGPSLEHQQQTYRCATPTSNSALKSPGTPMVFSPPPNATGQVVADTGSEEFIIYLQEKAKSSEHTPPRNDDSSKNQGTPSGASSSGSSPPKLTRERAMFPPRRKLFSRPDEEPGGGTFSLVTTFAPPRDPSGLRSSSETSVFDFPDTDSEGEMPVLEMQTLDEMRRDRRSHIKNSHQTTSATEIIEVIDDGTREADPEFAEPSTEESTPLDPFWSTACEKFLEQLKSGNIKRTCRRKKTAAELKSMYEKCEVNRMEAKKIEESELLDAKEESMNGDKTLCEDSHNNTEAVMKQLVTKSEESDEDIPLIKRKGRSKNEKEEKDTEDEISLAEIKARLGRKHNIDQLTHMKNWKHSRSSDRKIVSNSSDSAEDNVSDIYQQKVGERLCKRKCKGLGSDSNVSVRMKLRSKELLHKMRKERDKSKEVPYRSGCKKKKLQFGDGSDFRPGWEEELYRFKRSLRMPVRLINIPHPASIYRVSTSLPDLDPYPNSPAASTMDSSDFTAQNQQHSQYSSFLDQHQNTWSSLRSEVVDSDIDSNSNASISWLNNLDSEDATSSTVISSKFTTNNDSNSSILNVLVNKYSRNRVPRKRSQDKDIILQSSNPQTVLHSSSSRQEGGSEVQNKAINENVADGRCKRGYNKKKFVKVVKDDVESTNFSEESVHLEKSLKRAISNFHDAFQQSSEILPEKFASAVFRSRTRKQIHTLQQRATLSEIFGEDRPASAPPTCQESDKCESKIETNKQGTKSFRAINIQGLRSAGLRRSSKAVLNSKRHLLRRNNDLLRVLNGKDCLNQELLPKISGKESTKHLSQDGHPAACDLKGRRRRLKLRSVRRKFRSGFDYIRKKKKQQRKEGDAESNKDKKKCFYARPTSESAQDIQNEIKGWVINKGLGETLLHRAARLGYTDVAAYCLEKLDNAPSPRDNAGYTPLHEACSRGHLEIARLLLMYGADVSESALGGIRPLHEAAENGFTELIRLLLSYGADPLLATYSGYTPLSLASDDEARHLLQQHLADVQGLTAPPWTFQGPAACCDPPVSGYDPLSNPPCASPEPLEESEMEIETSEICLPVLYKLHCEPPEERWVLLQDLTQLLRIKSRDALLRQLCAEAKHVLREFKMADFLEQARCCHLLSSGEKVNVRASKVALVRYNEKVRELLGIEKVTINLR